MLETYDYKFDRHTEGAYGYLKPVSLEMVLSALLILLSGVTLALLIFFVEKLFGIFAQYRLKNYSYEVVVRKN